MKKTILSILLVGLLAGCGSNTSSTTKESSSNQISSSESSLAISSSSSVISTNSSSEDSIYADGSEVYEDIDISEVNKSISYSGVLIDIAIHKAIAVGYTYGFDFQLSNTITQDYRIKISDTDILEFEDVNGKKTLNAKKDGNVVLTIYDEDDFIHFRYVVHVRKILKPDAKLLDNYIARFDYWENIVFRAYYQFNLCFLGNYEGFLSGNDEGINLGNIEFTLEYQGLDVNTKESYVFKMVGFENLSGSTLSCDYIHLSITGDIMYLLDEYYQEDGSLGILTIDMFKPTSL